MGIFLVYPRAIRSGSSVPCGPERKTRSATPWPHSVFARRAYASGGLNDGFANPAPASLWRKHHPRLPGGQG